MPMQILRTPTPGNSPATLVEGQLAVEMASIPPKLWCGVPAAIDVSGRKLINPQATMAGGTAPSSPAAGDLWFDTTNNILMVYNGTAWEAVAVPATIVDATAPANPEQGLLWWDPTDGTLWIWYTDPTSSQWVEVTGGGGGAPGLFTATDDGIVPASGGGTTHFLRSDATWHEVGGPQKGVTDGSEPATGDIGEYLTANNSATVVGFGFVLVSLTLPAGDWNVGGRVAFNTLPNAGAAWTDGLRSVQTMWFKDGAQIFQPGTMTQQMGVQSSNTAANYQQGVSAGFVVRAMSIPTVRVLSAAASVIEMRVAATVVNGSDPIGQGFIWARRMR